jgi:hypothetical protein
MLASAKDNAGINGPAADVVRLGQATLRIQSPGAAPDVGLLGAYSGEDDRLFRRNVTGDSAESGLWLFFTRIGHVQSS